MRKAAGIAILALAAASCSQSTGNVATGGDYCSRTRAIGERHGDLVLEVGEAMSGALAAGANIDLSDPQGTLERARRALQLAADQVIARVGTIVDELRELRDLAPAEIRADFRTVLTAFQDTLANFRRYRGRLDDVTEENEQDIAQEGDRAAAPLESRKFERAALALGEYEGANCDGRGLFVVVESDGGSGSGAGSGSGGKEPAGSDANQPKTPASPEEPKEPAEPEEPAEPSQPVYPY